MAKGREMPNDVPDVTKMPPFKKREENMNKNVKQIQGVGWHRG